MYWREFVDWIELVLYRVHLIFGFHKICCFFFDQLSNCQIPQQKPSSLELLFTMLAGSGYRH
jgi:hypothetical protein